MRARHCWLVSRWRCVAEEPKGDAAPLTCILPIKGTLGKAPPGEGSSIETVARAFGRRYRAGRYFSFTVVLGCRFP